VGKITGRQCLDSYVSWVLKNGHFNGVVLEALHVWLEIHPKTAFCLNQRITGSLRNAREHVNVSRVAAQTSKSLEMCSEGENNTGWQNRCKTQICSGNDRKPCRPVSRRRCFIESSRASPPYIEEHMKLTTEECDPAVSKVTENSISLSDFAFGMELDLPGLLFI
jgi:hypothetical protein